MKLSQAEKELILANRKKEEDKFPKKIGFLKEDLYCCYDCKFYVDNCYFTTTEKKKVVKEFSDEFF